MKDFYGAVSRVHLGNNVDLIIDVRDSNDILSASIALTEDEASAAWAALTEYFLSTPEAGVPALAKVGA